MTLIEECAYAAERPILFRTSRGVIEGYTKRCGKESATAVVELLRSKGYLTTQALEELNEETK